MKRKPESGDTVLIHAGEHRGKLGVIKTYGVLCEIIEEGTEEVLKVHARLIKLIQKSPNARPERVRKIPPVHTSSDALGNVFFERLNYRELQDECKLRGISIARSKVTLARLVNACDKNFCADGDFSKPRFEVVKKKASVFHVSALKSKQEMLTQLLAVAPKIIAHRISWDGSDNTPTLQIRQILRHGKRLEQINISDPQFSVELNVNLQGSAVPVGNFDIVQNDNTEKNTRLWFDTDLKQYYFTPKEEPPATVANI